MGNELTTGVDQNFGKPSCPACPNFSPDPLPEVNDTRPDGEPPALVAETVIRRIEGERLDIVGVGGVTDEASSGMGVQADHEEESEVMRVPEGLEALGADLVVGGGVHEHHNEEHEMTCDTASLGVVDVQSPFRTNLCEALVLIDCVTRHKETYGYARH